MAGETFVMSAADGGQAMRHLGFVGLVIFVICASPASAQYRDLADVEQRLSNFIENTYLRSWFGQEHVIAEHFADPVEYYWGKRNVPLSRVIRDKMAFVRRWPSRDYHLIPESLKVKPHPRRENVYGAVFQYSFVARRPGKVSRGVGETGLLIRFIGDNIRILGEGGDVLERF